MCFVGLCVCPIWRTSSEIAEMWKGADCNSEYIFTVNSCTAQTISTVSGLMLYTVGHNKHYTLFFCLLLSHVLIIPGLPQKNVTNFGAEL